MKKVVCVMNLSHEHEACIMDLLNKRGITMIQLTDDMMNQKIGTVVHFEPFEKCEAVPTDFDEELMLFAHLTDEEVEEFVDELKTHFRFMGVMAMLTEHNQNWTFAEFFEEVMKDHRMFKAADALRAEMKLCETADPNKVQDVHLLNQTLMESFLYLKGQAFDEGKLVELKNKLNVLRTGSEKVL